MMIRSRIVIRGSFIRRIHRTRTLFVDDAEVEPKVTQSKIFNDSTEDKPKVPQSKYFKDDKKLTSMKESMMFNNIFTEVMKKKELREAKGKKLIEDVTAGFDGNEESIVKDINSKYQIVFGGKNEVLSEKDKKIFDLFKNATGDEAAIGEAAEMITNDIRKIPVSLVSSKLADYPESDNTTPDMSVLDKFYVPTSDQLASDSDFAIKKQTLKEVEKKQVMSNKLTEAMQPYLDKVLTKMETDYDLFNYFEALLKEHTNSTSQRNVTNNQSPEVLLQEIENNCKSNPEILPSPHEITLPHCIIYLLTSPEIRLPLERKYNLVSYVYQESKKATDISTYLKICNVDFYNILIQLTWDSFSEIHQVQRLLSEMTINGIMGDIQTIEVLDSIVKKLRHLNDSFMDDFLLNVEEVNPIASVKVVWCRENSTNLSRVQKYLKNLKENLILA